MKRNKNTDNFETHEVISNLRGTSKKIGGRKYTDKSISEIEEKILEERGLLKYVQWISNGFIKMEKSIKLMMVRMFLSILGILGFVIFDNREDEKTIEYHFILNKTIMKKTSYLMKITDQETLDKLKKTSVYFKKRETSFGYLFRDYRWTFDC